MAWTVVLKQTPTLDSLISLQSPITKNSRVHTSFAKYVYLTDLLLYLAFSSMHFVTIINWQTLRVHVSRSDTPKIRTNQSIAAPFRELKSFSFFLQFLFLNELTRLHFHNKCSISWCDAPRENAKNHKNQISKTSFI